MNTQRGRTRETCSILLAAVVGLMLSWCAGCNLAGPGGDGNGSVIGRACTAGGDECSGNTFCLFDDGTCDDPDRRGECAERPEICTLEFSPLCGCDGQTYGNRCEATGAGVSVDHDGECM